MREVFGHTIAEVMQQASADFPSDQLFTIIPFSRSTFKTTADVYIQASKDVRIRSLLRRFKLGPRANTLRGKQKYEISETERTANFVVPKHHAGWIIVETEDNDSTNVTYFYDI